MRFFKTHWLIKKSYSSLTWDKPKENKKIYLTFDDGPIPEVTEYVLEVLKEYRAKATFFCVGDNVRKYPNIFKKVVSAGHSIGNHTYNHFNGWKTDINQYLRNIEKCQSEIEKELQKNPQKPLFRPPYGKITRQQIQQLKSKYQIIMWDILSYDFDASLPSEVCLQKCIQKTEEGSIVVFHDSIKTEAKLKTVLPQYLQHFSNLGYQFEAL